MISKKYFLADGSTTNFLSDYIIKNDEYCRVYVSDSYELPVSAEERAALLANVSQWELVNNNVVFYEAPTAGKYVTIWVASTPEELDTYIDYAFITYDNIANIETVVDNMDSVTTVAGDTTNINTIITNLPDINAVAAIGTDISAVNDINTEVVAVSDIKQEIINVDNNSTDISTVAANNSSVSTVSGNISSVNTVAGIDANVTTVADSITNVDTVAVNIADVTNFADVYYGPSATAPTTRRDGSALVAGDLWFDTANGYMKVWNGSAWLQSSVQGASREVITATEGQTSILVSSGYNVDQLDVYLNGQKMITGSDFTAIDGQYVTFLYSLQAGDKVEVISLASIATDEANLIQRVTFTADGATATFDTTHTLVSKSSIMVSINGITQGASAFSVSGSTFTMNETPEDGDVLDVMVFGVSPTSIIQQAESIVYTPVGETSTNVQARLESIDAKLAETVSVKDFGAVGDGVTDDTAAFNAAIATNKKVVVPSGSYVVSNITMISGMHIVGEKATVTSSQGTILRVRGDNAAAFLKDGLSEIQNITIENLQIRSDSSSYINTRGIYANENTNYIAWATFKNVETWAELETSYSAFFIFGRWEQCRDGYYGTPYSGGHAAVKSLPENPTQFKRTNTNRFDQCDFFQGNANDGVLQFTHGGLLSFNQCDFEALGSEAIKLYGMQGVRFNECWFEAITADQMVVAGLDSTPEGCRTIVFESCQFDLNSTSTYIILLGSACSAQIRDCSFVRVDADHIVTNDFSKLERFTSNQILSGSSYALTFQGEAYSIEESMSINNVVMSDRIRPFNKLKLYLSDNPASPETVATFSFPAQGEPEAQRGDLWLINIEATVNAAGTTPTIHLFNHQKLRLYVSYDKASDVLEATLLTADSESFGGGGGFWAAAPTWSAVVSGTDVLLQMTSNPGGTSYANGIHSTVTGFIHDQTTLPVGPNGEERAGTPTARLVSVS